jgi:hypothetical protein
MNNLENFTSNGETSVTWTSSSLSSPVTVRHKENKLSEEYTASIFRTEVTNLNGDAIRKYTRIKFKVVHLHRTKFHVIYFSYSTECNLGTWYF